MQLPFSLFFRKKNKFLCNFLMPQFLSQFNIENTKYFSYLEAQQFYNYIISNIYLGELFVVNTNYFIIRYIVYLRLKIQYGKDFFMGEDYLFWKNLLWKYGGTLHQDKRSQNSQEEEFLRGILTVPAVSQIMWYRHTDQLKLCQLQRMNQIILVYVMIYNLFF